jgi:hypothetical protein
MATVLGVLTAPDQTVRAVRRVKEAGFRQVEAYSPIPSHEIIEAVDPAPSGVRAWTLIGCLLGAFTGYLVTIWMSYDWELITGGKPFASVPAYTVIAYELNILFGGVLTVIGLLLHGLWFTKADARAYRPSFSGGEFGCLVSCHAEQVSRVQGLLREAGCREVRVVEP